MQISTRVGVVHAMVLSMKSSLRLDATVRDIVPHFMLMIDNVRERAEEFDVLYFHIDLFHFPLFRSIGRAFSLIAATASLLPACLPRSARAPLGLPSFTPRAFAAASAAVVLLTY
jgi:hypothetical protein